MHFVQSFAAQPLRYREARRDQRLLLPRFHAVVAGHVLPTANWSLGGLLLCGPTPPGLAPDALVTGLLGGETRTGLKTVPFAAHLLRLASSPRGLALRFADANAQVIEFLEECLRRRLAGRHP
jgi:hypothetical protein